MRKPDFFLVGAAKCGTTAMYQYLGEHPEIFIPDTASTVENVLGGKKELHFFCDDLNFVRPTTAEYLDYFSQVKHEKRLGESSVFYLYSQNAAHKIKAFAPEAQIIVMLRNPIDVMYSWHSQLVFWGDEDILDFGEALAAESDRKNGLRIPEQRDHPVECFFYRQLVQFSEQLTRYFELFGQERVKVVIFEDFKANTNEVYQDILAFLGVDLDFAPNYVTVNQNKTVRNRGLQQLVRRPPSGLRTMVKKVVPASLRQSLRSEILKRNIQAKPRPEMSFELQQALQQEFRTEVTSLSSLLGRDLTFWLEDYE